MQPMMEAYPKQFGKFDVVESRPLPMEDSPIRQRMEQMQQGDKYDTRPYMAPRRPMMSPLRRRLLQMQQMLSGMGQGDPSMNMPVSGI